MNAIEKSALSRLDEFVTSRDKFQFVECTIGVLLVVLTPLYAPFGRFFAKNPESVCFRDFFIQAAGLAYNYDAVVDISL